MDGVDPPRGETKGALTYPFAEGPEPGSGAAVRIAEGVFWLRMPLGGSLRFINVWLLEDGDGWTVVDTGMRTEATAQAWRRAFADLLGERPVVRVIATHMHPDHVGMAGWICRKWGASLWMSRLEYLTCRLMAADTGREAPQDGVRFYRAAGWDEAAIETYRARFGGFGKGVYPLPDSYRRIGEGEEILIGGRVWRVVVGSGHSPEHACLHQAELGLLISGDQVLPKISSNVSVFPTEPDADPLSDWLASLASVKAKVGEETLVLPAHNDPFYGLHARLDRLIEGHERGLERLWRALARPRRAVDVFGALFARPIGPDVLGMATGESLAHLNCLRRRGKASFALDAEGVAWWRAEGLEAPSEAESAPA
jgi:glyoxylase-like metal-dependent hydrolase (beta-lactamase superfamily II)